MTWGSPPESAICREKVLLSLGGCLCYPPCPLVPAGRMSLLGPPCFPHPPPAPWPGRTWNGEMGTPCNPGAEGNGTLHGQQGLPGCPLPPTYLQEGGVGGIQLGVTLHLQARGMILAPWGALSLAEVAHGHRHWRMATQLAHPTPARWRQGTRRALSPQNHHPLPWYRGDLPPARQCLGKGGGWKGSVGGLVRHPVCHTCAPVHMHRYTRACSYTLCTNVATCTVRG